MNDVAGMILTFLIGLAAGLVIAAFLFVTEEEE